MIQLVSIFSENVIIIYEFIYKVLTTISFYFVKESNNFLLGFYFLVHLLISLYIVVPSKVSINSPSDYKTKVLHQKSPITFSLSL